LPNQRRSRMDDMSLISRAAHVVERTGLAMSGAMCGTFVAALQIQVNAALFDSVGFILSMVVIGMIGFYLGIDIPRLRGRPRVDAVELLSATGTFLAAVAALISVYAFVFDQIPQRAWDLTIVSWWLLGIAMQIGAGLIGRLRLARKAPIVVKVQPPGCVVSSRHCEERSDEAIHSFLSLHGLLRFARNDGFKSGNDT
jgi:hypothetical protein